MSISMAYHASPKKRLRRDKKKYGINKARLSALKTALKKVRAHPEQEELLQKAQKALTKAALKRVIHANAAARKTSRLMRLANHTKQQSLAAAN